jgi:hypothetical protein
MHEAVLSIGLDEEDVILAAARQCAGTLAGVEWSLSTGSNDVTDVREQVRDSFWMLAEALLGYEDRHGCRPEILPVVRKTLRPWLFMLDWSNDDEQRRWFTEILAA